MPRLDWIPLTEDQGQGRENCESARQQHQAIFTENGSRSSLYRRGRKKWIRAGSQKNVIP